jgi:hypothetical protein
MSKKNSFACMEIIFFQSKECQTFAQKTKLELHIKKKKRKKKISNFLERCTTRKCSSKFSEGAQKGPKTFLSNFEKIKYTYIYIYMLATQKYLNKALKHNSLIIYYNVKL